jgi:hypothetical protein
MTAEYQSHISTPRNGSFGHSVITSARYRSFEIDIRRRSLGYFERVTEKRLISASAINGEEIRQISYWQSKRCQSCNLSSCRAKPLEHLPASLIPSVLCACFVSATDPKSRERTATPSTKKTRRRGEGGGTRSLNCRIAKGFSFLLVRPIFVGAAKMRT